MIKLAQVYSGIVLWHCIILYITSFVLVCNRVIFLSSGIYTSLPPFTSKSSATNYRPISLLCIISKVLEHIVYKHLLDSFSTSISPYQFGFRQKHSTLQQLLIFLQNIFNSDNINTQTDVTYLDFRKAFNRVAHNEMLFKLHQTGITSNVWRWLKAYLTQRHQCVSINGNVSSSLPVISGVPQESIVALLLFLIFINDLPKSVSRSTLLLFVDDTKCAHPIAVSSDCLLLQYDLVV